MSVPLLDLKAQYQSIKQDIDTAVSKVFESQLFINGPEVKQCELAIASYCGTKYATGVSSGSDALVITLMAEQIGFGDEVIVPDYSFFATAGAVVRVGAKPVFVDILPDTYNIDPAKIESAITEKTKAIIPVHLFGQMADMDPILELAEKYHFLVIEDAAQSIGAEYKGCRAGSMGHYGCFSFFPSKNLGCAGDGGIVTTNDETRDELLKTYRNHGSKIKYHHIFVGGNFRLDSIHAAVVLAKLPYLDGWSEKRKSNAERYQKLIEQYHLLGNGILSLPVIKESRHIFNQYILRVERRDELVNYLKQRSIGCEVYYPYPFHLLECFQYLGYKEGDFPVSEQAAKETIAIPIYPELTDEQAEEVIRTIAEFYQC
ncbi:MAG: DegT/DnrJ/EryC1/StrS family aminotransferase [bacterium]|nr:DegT/DnrJ/EryC1/StrS family aminotransferase [bacterium]